MDRSRLEGNFLFTGAVSITLSFHPQGENVNDVTSEGKAETTVTRSGGIRL